MQKSAGAQRVPNRTAEQVSGAQAPRDAPIGQLSRSPVHKHPGCTSTQRDPKTTAEQVAGAQAPIGALAGGTKQAPAALPHACSCGRASHLCVCGIIRCPNPCANAP